MQIAPLTTLTTSLAAATKSIDGAIKAATVKAPSAERVLAHITSASASVRAAADGAAQIGYHAKRGVANAEMALTSAHGAAGRGDFGEVARLLHDAKRGAADALAGKPKGGASGADDLGRANGGDGTAWIDGQRLDPIGNPVRGGGSDFVGPDGASYGWDGGPAHGGSDDYDGFGANYSGI